MHYLDKNKVGCAVGGVFGLVHLTWSILVALNWAKPFMDWILGLHFINMSYSMNEFKVMTALGLIVVTAIIGYVVGWVLAGLWNWLHRDAHGM